MIVMAPASRTDLIGPIIIDSKPTTKLGRELRGLPDGSAWQRNQKGVLGLTRRRSTLDGAASPSNPVHSLAGATGPKPAQLFGPRHVDLRAQRREPSG